MVQMLNMAYPTCRSGAAIEMLSGHRVLLIGIYSETDELQKPKSSSPSSHMYVEIRFNDDSSVALEPGWSASAKRSAEGRQKLLGKTVLAIGTLWSEMPAPLKPFAYAVCPCLASVESIKELAS